MAAARRACCPRASPRLGLGAAPPPVTGAAARLADAAPKKRGATKRTEHFLRWFHHFRWIVLHRYGVVHSVSDPEMLADILTKCVNPAKFQLCAKGLRGS